jgi:2,5-dioxopentanoate dehydrogenase
MYNDTTALEIDAAMQLAQDAFMVYKQFSLRQRANFMRAVAWELENCGDGLITTAMAETNLPEARLCNERIRAVFQLTAYADACEKGNWLNATIDTANTERNPPKPDVRKTLIPLGPVVVFGASNFPFAYSTAGGDTASAFAAGCPVIVKAHPAHAGTSTLVAKLIVTAAEKCNMPKGVFNHVYGKDFYVGKQLVMHAYTKAVAFTGSYNGGKQLFDWANGRKEPIPVFAEMGSTNPVFLFPEKLQSEAAVVAKMFAASITLGVGQFCTKPGIIIGIDNENLASFTNALAAEIKNITPALMLHTGIAASFEKNKSTALQQDGVQMLATLTNTNAALQNNLLANAAIAITSATTFLQNPVLHQEVFGPYAIVIKCTGIDEMYEVAKHLEGQLTATLMATHNDLKNNGSLIEIIKNCCGRIILNTVPTGVEVCGAMHHGGPFPSTTDSRFGSVGADAIKRFARPIAYQNWSDELLPHELQNENPLDIWRTVNGELTK